MEHPVLSCHVFAVMHEQAGLQCHRDYSCKEMTGNSDEVGFNSNYEQANVENTDITSLGERKRKIFTFSKIVVITEP
jgi:hypothetical protein